MRVESKELMELMEEAVNVAVSFRLRATDVGVKGAVGALAPAEREMEVEVQAGVDASPLGAGVSSAPLLPQAARPRIRHIVIRMAVSFFILSSFCRWFSFLLS